MSGRRLKSCLLNRYCIIGRSESVTRQARCWHMHRSRQVSEIRSSCLDPKPPYARSHSGGPYIETTFFSKLYHFFLQKTTFFSKLNSALFDRSHCSRRRSETMCLWRRDWMFAPTIRYQFKRHLFTRRPCTGPHLWAGPEGDCNCWDTGIEISFNFSRSRQFAFVRNACGH